MIIRTLKMFGILTAACIALVVMLLLWTRGGYVVAPLVTEDDALPSVIVDGVRLHMRQVDGPAGASTIIVLHGGPGGDFRSLLALSVLSETHNVVFYDQRGAGLSERVPAEKLTLDDYILELDGVKRLVSPNAPVTLIGHSWGAMLATAYMGARPNNVQAAVLIEPGYLDGAGKSAWDAAASRYMSGIGYWAEAVVTGFRAQLLDGPDAAAADDFLIGHMVGVFANHPENPYHCGDGYNAPNWRFGAMASQVWADTPDAVVDHLAADVSNFSGPVLLLAGECNDWLGPLQNSHRQLFGNANLVIIPSAGHDVVWDNLEASLDVIRRFLDVEKAE
ncbi:proline iminopeptidase [Rubricella aquisinus]|uniref:Proline iminopeptidase n=1 Tax=Rubricella aquisinus TaxID=2028108 RepID=A0A840X8V4_9RHOB|nr:alpha/beta hydrolase [Rubricella aquisinus]MBB5517157.1 proline iminopeptidase [Rubricella aquisinus]